MEYTFSKNSTWDLDNHIAIPTLDFIRNNTGLDLMTGGFAILGDVKGKVKQLTIDAKNKLYNNKSPETKNALSYYIAYDQSYNMNWLNFVTAYIYDMIINTEITPATKERMQVLNIYGFTDGTLYDIENSTLEW